MYRRVVPAALIILASASAAPHSSANRARDYAMSFERARALHEYAAALASDPKNLDLLAGFAEATPDRDLERALLQRLLQIDPHHVAGRHRAEVLDRLGTRIVNQFVSPYDGYRLRMPVAYSREGRPAGWVLRVRLNGGPPLRMLMDTGARRLLIRAGAARRARLERLGATALGGFGSAPGASRRSSACPNGPDRGPTVVERDRRCLRLRTSE